MLPVSKEFHAAMVADNRRTFGRVTIDYTGPFVDQNITASANEQANAAVLLPQVADNLATVPRRWASADGTTLADGLSFPAPSIPTDGQMGWWGEQMAGVDGAFSPSFPTLTVNFASRPVHSLRVVGDSARGEFPVDFDIRLIGAGGAVRFTRTVTGNALMIWQEIIAPVIEVTQYVLEVRRWSHAGRQAKIVEVFTSIQETYEGDNLISIGLLEEREIAQQSLPIGVISANEITVRLDNSTRKFDAGNRESPLYQLLRQNRRIRAWLGMKGDGSGVNMQQAVDFNQGVRRNLIVNAGRLELPAVSPPVFSRASTAYRQDGVLVNSGVPRFEPGKFGQAVMVEDGTTNLLNAVSSTAEANMLSNDSAFATLVYVSNFGRSDNTSAVSTQIAAGAASAGFYFTAAGFAPVIAGLVYTASCYVYTNHIGRSYTIFAGWLRADNSTIASPSATFSLTAGEWTRLVITGTAPVDAVNLRIAVMGTGTAAVGEQYWFDDICVEQKPYATSWQIGGTPRAEEIISAPLANVVLPAQGTIEFWWNPQIPFPAITNQGASPMLLQIGNYMSNSSLTLWAFFNWATPGTEPRLVLFVRGQTASGWSTSPGVRESGSGWYQQGVWNHYTVTWSAGNNFRVYRNGVLVGGPYVIADPVTSWAGTQVWFANNGVGQGMPGALIDDIRISSRARTDQEIADAFNGGQPMLVDADTTYSLRMDGDLNYGQGGDYTSPEYDLSTVGTAITSGITWQAPADGVTRDVSARLDGQAWTPVTNGGALPFSPGQLLTGRRLQLHALMRRG